MTNRRSVLYQSTKSRQSLLALYTVCTVLLSWRLQRGGTSPLEPLLQWYTFLQQLQMCSGWDLVQKGRDKKVSFFSNRTNSSKGRRPLQYTTFESGLEISSSRDILLSLLDAACVSNCMPQLSSTPFCLLLKHLREALQKQPPCYSYVEGHGEIKRCHQVAGEGVLSDISVFLRFIPSWSYKLQTCGCHYPKCVLIRKGDERFEKISFSKQDLGVFGWYIQN